jgi:hypothetical protein
LQTKNFKILHKFYGKKMSDDPESKPALVIEICVKSVTEFESHVPMHVRAVLSQRDREAEEETERLPLIHRLAKAFATTTPINVNVVGNEMPIIYETDSDDESLCENREFHKWHGMWRCITEKVFSRSDNNGWTRLTFWTVVRMQTS